MSQRYAVYVLGAGFSVPAGLPTADELWREVLERALKLDRRAGKFKNDLDAFIAFKKNCFGEELDHNSIDFEEFLGFLDIEHQLWLRGSDTWSEDGNEGQVVVKTLIGQVLTERTPAPCDIPDFYVEFAKRLSPSDWVVTFNYDVLLERALEAAGVKYRLFPSRYAAVNTENSEVDEEVVVLKVHGSVDWFDRTRYLQTKQLGQVPGKPEFEPPDPLFNSDSGFKMEKILEGRRDENNPLNEMYRLKHVEGFYSSPPWFMAVPALINPSTSKVLYAARQSEFWTGFGEIGVTNFRMVIIGYSLPDHDAYTKQVLYSLVDNYQRYPATDYGEVFGLTKEPLLLIDCRQDEASLDEYKQHYSFVDWEKSVLLANGFSDEALAYLD